MKKITIISLTIILLSINGYGQVFEESILDSLKKHFTISEYDRPSEIIRFNKDTILIAGYLEDLNNSEPRYEQKKNVVYRTENRGQSWEISKFNGDAWIYNFHSNKNGEVWLGGSDEFIHFSNDYGKTWERKPKPFKPINRVLSIYMVNSNYGIAGGLSNDLAITYDNWRTTKQIESPLDQGKYRILKQSSRDRIDKIGILDSLILINQNDYIFYTKIDKIDWNKFNIPVHDFQINSKNREINLSSRNGKFFVIGSDLNLIRTYQEDFIWEEIPKSNYELDVTNFLKHPIKSIEITSTKFEPDKRVGMVILNKEIVQKVKIRIKENDFIYKPNRLSPKTETVSLRSINSLLKDNLIIDLDSLIGYIQFEQCDISDFNKLLLEEKQSRIKQEEWGGNFTSQISIENTFFNNPKDAIQTKIKQEHLSSIYNQIYFPFFLSEDIDNFNILLKNGKGNKIEITNKNALLYSLPWTIKYKNKTYNTFNPKITLLIRELLSEDFSNRESLLGGELIFNIIEEQIIENLEYKKENGY